MSGGVSSGGTAGGASGPGVAGGVDTSSGAARLPNGGASLLGRLLVGTLPVHPHLDDATGGVIDYLRTSWGTDHLAEADPHPQYASDDDLAAYLTASEADALFLTQTEGDARYLQTGQGGISLADADLRYVNTAGDAMSGALTVAGANFAPATDNGTVLGHPGLRWSSLYVAGSGNFGNYLLSTSLYVDAVQAGLHLRNGASSPRWDVLLDGSPETGSNAGANLEVTRSGDAGTSLGPALTITRATGAATFGGDVTITNNLILATTPSIVQAQGALYLRAVGGNLHLNASTGYVTAETTGKTLGHPSVPWTNVLTDAVTVLGKPLSVSPTAGNALTWDGTGLYAAGGGGGGLPTTGGTMSGTITADGAAARSGGSLKVVGGGATATDARLYGSATPAFTSSANSSREVGLRFQSTAAQYLVAVRWYRLNTTTLAPVGVRLWDTTSTATPVWSLTTPSAWNDTAVGWKEHRLAAGTQPLLVAGRVYALTMGTSSTASNQASLAAYTPTPDAGLTFVEHTGTGSGQTVGVYPTSTGTTASGLDGGFRASLSAATPAASGTVRLPNGNDGAVAWRNGTDGADLSLTMDASDRLSLVVGAGSLTTTATAGAAGSLPSQPLGYLTVVLNGTTTAKIPYFSA